MISCVLFCIAGETAGILPGSEASDILLGLNPEARLGDDEGATEDEDVIQERSNGVNLDLSQWDTGLLRANPAQSLLDQFRGTDEGTAEDEDEGAGSSGFILPSWRNFNPKFWRH